MKMVIVKLCHRFLAVAIVLAAPGAQSADLGGYVPGTTGLKGATLPPPGVYAISLSFSYRSTDLRDEKGERVTQVHGRKFTGKIDALATLTSITYISEFKVLGANYGARIADSIGNINTETHVGPVVTKHKESGNADLYVEPIDLSWHLPRFDAFASYGFYAPVGDFRREPFTISDRWTHLFSMGMTAYLDLKKTWAFSIVPRYEIHRRNIHEDFRVGQEALYEWGISKTFRFASEEQKAPWAVLDVGPVGYAAYKVTDDRGPGVMHPFARYSTHAAGAEAGLTISNWHRARISLRYEQEYLVRSHPQGQEGVFRFSVKF
jgi:hypothetical protein